MYEGLTHSVARAVLDEQPELLHRLLETACRQCAPAANSILHHRIAELSQGGDILQFMQDADVLAALTEFGGSLHSVQRHDDALAWGKVAYVATRRFAHCWLPFLNIVMAAGEVRTEQSAPNAHRPTANLIPRNIVQYWDKSDPPEDVARIIASWKTATPGFKHRLFDDAAAQDFIADCYGEALLTTYRTTRHAAGKADLFRLAWLAEHGGIYIDADDRRVGDLAELVPAASGLILNWSTGPHPCANNWFIATHPHHPLIIKMLAVAIWTTHNADALGLRISPWILTGPGLFTMILLDEIVMAQGEPALLADLILLSPDHFRRVVASVPDLNYRSDPLRNWKLSYI